MITRNKSYEEDQMRPLNKNRLREGLRSPDLVAQTYRQVLDSPEILGQLSDEEAMCFYAVACLSEQVCPKWYKGLAEKDKPTPNKGFLDYLIEKTGLTNTPETRTWARKAAGSFVPQKMMQVTSGELDPICYA